MVYNKFALVCLIFVLRYSDMENMGDQFLRKNRSMAFAKYLKHSIKSRGDSFSLSLSPLLSYVLVLQIVKIRAAGLERDHKNDPIDVQPGNKKMTFRCRNVCSV